MDPIITSDIFIGGSCGALYGHMCDDFVDGEPCCVFVFGVAGAAVGFACGWTVRFGYTRIMSSLILQ
jgi:hypothetical protein